MRIAVIGSRDYQDDDFIWEVLNDFLSEKNDITSFVSGGAKGPDSIGEEWANAHKIPTQIFYPDWEKHGKGAGFIRNRDIVENADIIFAFWNGHSNGTKNSIDTAHKTKTKIIVYVSRTKHDGYTKTNYDSENSTKSTRLFT